MEVRYHDALYIPRQIATGSGSPGLPRLTGRRVIVSGVDEGPAASALDEVRGDEAQREWYGQFELPDAFRHRGGFSDGLRGELGRGDGHTTAPKKSEISRLARSGRS
jgi:hypothetical protein